MNLDVLLDLMAIWESILLSVFCAQMLCTPCTVLRVHNSWFYLSRFLASLLVEVGEYDISGPNEMMSTKEMKVEVTREKMCLKTSDNGYPKVKRVVVHKDYQAPTFENDIAILELENPIERQPHVVPICMPR